MPKKKNKKIKKRKTKKVAKKRKKKSISKVEKELVYKTKKDWITKALVNKSQYEKNIRHLSKIMMDFGKKKVKE